GPGQVPVEAGVVDEDVDRAVRSGGTGHVGGTVVVGEVTDDRVGRPAGLADLPRDLLRAVLVPAVHHDRGTLGRQQLRGGLTEPRTRTRDEHTLTGQVEVHLAVPSHKPAAHTRTLRPCEVSLTQVYSCRLLWREADPGGLPRASRGHGTPS